MENPTTVNPEDPLEISDSSSEEEIEESPKERAPSSSARINEDQAVVVTGTDLAPTNVQLESVVEADGAALPEDCNTRDRDGDLPAPSNWDVKPFPEPNARGEEVGAANLEG
ncbi:hypothetical protein Bca52824_017370 [Brassica carinata]|uniref:Uncharacterized protein n=1 Tax=Brassica carinata TaxID=52824 RepID=A0A8X7VNH6_BRACI|nr:hypothetical protein Bca52824_017370 [Brassica carinata]